jgi:hypothetical protein
MHQWRKRVKDLRYAAEMLDRRDPDGGEGLGRSKRGKRRRKQAERGKDVGYIRRLARQADELGELLGEEHDLAVLAERVRADGKPGDRHGLGPDSPSQSPRLHARWVRGTASKGGSQTRKALLKLIARRRRRLRRRALSEGERLYRRRPKKFVGRMRDAYTFASRA